MPTGVGPRLRLLALLLVTLAGCGGGAGGRVAPGLAPPPTPPTPGGSFRPGPPLDLVLVLGGLVPDDAGAVLVPTSQAELWEPGLRRSTLVGSPASAAAAVALLDGRALLVGGAATELFTPR